MARIFWDAVIHKYALHDMCRGLMMGKGFGLVCVLEARFGVSFLSFLMWMGRLRMPTFSYIKTSWRAWMASDLGRSTTSFRLVGIIYWVSAWALWNIYFTDVQVILAIQTQIQCKSKRKMKSKTQRVKQPTGGRFAPTSQVPPLAFLFSFSFCFTLNLNFPTTHPPALVPRCEKKSRKKTKCG